MSKLKCDLETIEFMHMNDLYYVFHWYYMRYTWCIALACFLVVSYFFGQIDETIRFLVTWMNDSPIWLRHIKLDTPVSPNCTNWVIQTKLRVPESSPKVEDDNWDTQGRKWSLITDQQSKGWWQLISNSASRSRAESNCWSCMPQINRICGRDCACSDWSCHLNRKDSFTWSLHQ